MSEAKKKSPFDIIIQLEERYVAKRGELIDAATVTAGKSLVTLTAGKIEFAVEVGLVVETLRYSPPHVLPRCYDWVLGVIDLRGEIIPVIDFSAFNGQGAAKINQHSRVIIIRHDDYHYALLVSAVSAVRLVPEETIMQLKTATKPSGTRLSFTQAVLIDSQQKLFLDIKEFSHNEEFTKLTY